MKLIAEETIEKVKHALQACTHDANDYNCYQEELGTECSGCSGDKERELILKSLETELKTINYYGYPCHSMFARCCGIFDDFRETGIYCNECGKEINEAMAEFFFEIKDMLRAMWGGMRRGADINFKKCETGAMDKWLNISEKMGIFGDKKDTE